MTQKAYLFAYLMIVILVSSAFVLGLVFFANRMLITRTLFSTQEEKFNALARSAVEDISLHLTTVEEMVHQNILFFKGLTTKNQANTQRLSAETIESHPTIFGMEVIFSEAGRRNQDDLDFTAVYVCRSGDEILAPPRDFASDYRSDWFRIPYETKKPRWSEPYFDAPADMLMVTYSVPLINEQGEVEAIFTADISLEWLEKSLALLPMGKTGRPILFSAEQNIIVCSFADWALKESLSSLAEKAQTPERRRDWENLSAALKSSPFGSYRYRRPTTGSPAWIYYRTIPQSGWTLGCILPEREVFELASSVNRTILLIGILGLFLLIFPAYAIARSVGRPLHQLTCAAEEVARGRFNVPLPAAKRIGELSRLIFSFDKMRTDLVRYIDDVTESARVKERISSELSLAHSIQLGMVPKNFLPPFEYKVEIYAMLEPAMEVGGDLYDFAMLDENLFYFCIGDVSGKGVPASLFMAVGKTLLKSTMQSVRDPAEVLRRVNTELSQHNASSLFITAICGLFDLKSNTLIFANAGHNPPVLFDHNGHADFLELIAGFPLAMLEETEYTNQTIVFAPGASLFLYTDGVTDAENPEGLYYGSKKLREKLANLSAESVQELVERMMADIHSFARGAKQSDDITILAFQNNRG